MGKAEEIISRTTIGRSGGNIDLGWVIFEFPSGLFSTQRTIEISVAILEFPRSDVKIITEPLSIDISSESGDASSDRLGGGYICRFPFREMTLVEGEIDVANPYIDIYEEWTDEEGGEHHGLKWADRDDDSIFTTLNNGRITLAVVDYSRYSELTAPPSLIKNPLEVIDFLRRRYSKTEFHNKNDGPLAERIPVVLIHGLNLLRLGEDESFSDKEAVQSKDIWQPFFDMLNYCDWIYDDFKFFWFEYATGDEIFGTNGSGLKLKEHIREYTGHAKSQLHVHPVVIIAHSMGGLVARDFMQNHGGHVLKLITICTPHYGTPLASLAMHNIGELFPYKSRGLSVLGCYEPIKYKDPITRKERELLHGNTGLSRLNESFDENNSLLICYGATSMGHTTTGPKNPFDKLMLSTFRRITGPEWLMETSNGYRSDGMVPWRSQYYRRQGDFPDPDFSRTSTAKYHRDIFEDFDILVGLYRDLCEIREESRKRK